MLRGKKVILRPIDIESDLKCFQRWVNDLDVVRFLGKPLKPVTKEKERELLQKLLCDESNIMFAIETFEGTHIGITGLHKISYFDGTAVTGTFIGDKRYWGVGYGTDAKMLLLWYAFKMLNLRRINSAVIAFNKRSLGCQLKCGYAVEGVKRKEVYKNGHYHDLVLLAVFRKGWMKRWREYQRGAFWAEKRDRKGCGEKKISPVLIWPGTYTSGGRRHTVCS
ncbi:MAG: GNAT family protein [bacterium]|nr:GNAT family protein [bacterium]